MEKKMKLSISYVYEVAVQLFPVAKKLDSVKMKDEITKFPKSLLQLWQKAFGVGHTLELTTVKVRLKKLAKDYYKDVHVKSHRDIKSFT